MINKKGIVGASQNNIKGHFPCDRVQHNWWSKWAKWINRVERLKSHCIGKFIMDKLSGKFGKLKYHKSNFID